MDAPEELSGNALLAWHAFAAEIGEALPTDRAALTVLSLAWAEMSEAEKAIAHDGTVIKLPNGYPGPNPYCKVRKEARSVVMTLLNEMGLTRLAKSKTTKHTEEPAGELTF